MAGYMNYSISNNAITAYRQGLLPKSKATGLIKALTKALNVEIDFKNFDITDHRYEEWHHTSSKYNITYFYNAFNILKSLMMPSYEVETALEIEDFLDGLQAHCSFTYDMTLKEIKELALKKLSLKISSSKLKDLL